MTIPVDGSASPKAIEGPSGAIPSHDEKMIAYAKGKYSLDQQVFVVHADATSERIVSSNLHGCTKPVFTHVGDALYFFQEHWPNGPTGVPTFSLWKAKIDPAKIDFVADAGLFDAPLQEQPAWFIVP